MSYNETGPIFLTIPPKRKLTFPKETFKPGQLIMVFKVTKVQAEQYMLDLQKKENLKIVNQLQNEITGINEE